MNSKAQLLLISLVILLNISGCSTIKSFFPDKEKDYQLTSEIAELKIPSDLSNNSIQNIDVIEDSPKVSQRFERTIVKTDELENQQKPVEKDRVEFADGATRIRFNGSIERTWRKVGKALTRHSIEITNRNKTDRIYLVQYDPDFKKVKDGSLWDEVLFIFGGDPAQEQEFGIKLVENKVVTEIFVVDKNNKPLSEGAGLKLLNLLHKTLQEDSPDEE